MGNTKFRTFSEKNNFSIFLWFVPADSTLAKDLASDLVSNGVDVYPAIKAVNSEKPIFDPTDWQLSKSEIIVFLLSKNSIRSPTLIPEIEKVLRRKEVVVLPAFIEDIPDKDLPTLLKFIRPLRINQDSKGWGKSLLDEINRKRLGTSNKQFSLRQYLENPLWIIIGHFRRYLTLPPLTFCWQITIENLIVSLSITGIILVFFQPNMRTNLDSLTAGNFLWMVIILGPIIETVALQMIPVFIARVIGLQFIGQMALSIVPFALLHFSRSVGAGIGAGVIGGFYSAFTYVHWRSKSFWTAFWTTTFSHCLYNLAIFAMIVGDY